MDITEFRIGCSNRAHVIVSVRGRQWPEANDFWDGNVVSATITIAAGAFRGELDADLRAEEVARFRDALRPLYEALDGRARFDTVDGWLQIDIRGDGKGHFRAACEADDQPGLGNRLVFAIDFDQTELPDILRGLDAICDVFPVVAAPPQGS